MSDSQHSTTEAPDALKPGDYRDTDAFHPKLEHSDNASTRVLDSMKGVSVVRVKVFVQIEQR